MTEPTDRERRAYHEAGHAVAAILHRLVFGAVTIAGAAGEVDLQAGADPPREELEGIVVATLAGPWAVRDRFGVRADWSRRDAAIVEDLARALAANGRSLEAIRAELGARASAFLLRPSVQAAIAALAAELLRRGTIPYLEAGRIVQEAVEAAGGICLAVGLPSDRPEGSNQAVMLHVDEPAGWRDLAFDDSSWDPSVTYTRNPLTASPPNGAEWITDIDTGNRPFDLVVLFRQEFTLSAGRVTSAQIIAQADDWLMGVWINNVSIWSRSDNPLGGPYDYAGRTIEIPPSALREGTNVLAIRIQNAKAGTPGDPALAYVGLAFRLEVS